jgi:hypothetical protein
LLKYFDFIFMAIPGSDAVGRTLGLRQLTPKDSAAINAIVSGAKARQSTLSRITGMPVKVTEQEWQKIINIQKKSKPW